MGIEVIKGSWKVQTLNLVTEARKWVVEAWNGSSVGLGHDPLLN